MPPRSIPRCRSWSSSAGDSPRALLPSADRQTFRFRGGPRLPPVEINGYTIEPGANLTRLWHRAEPGPTALGGHLMATELALDQVPPGSHAGSHGGDTP